MTLEAKLSAICTVTSIKVIQLCNSTSVTLIKQWVLEGEIELIFRTMSYR